MSSQDTQVNTIGCSFLPKTELNTLRPYTFAELHAHAYFLYSAYCAHTKSTPKSACIATSYLLPLLQNYEDLSIKHNINLVSTEYPKPQNSTWLEKVKRIFKIVKNKVYLMIVYWTSYLILALEATENKQSKYMHM